MHTTTPIRSPGIFAGYPLMGVLLMLAARGTIALLPPGAWVSLIRHLI